MAKCSNCGGSGDTENANGCTVPCRTCKGTGQQPEAPAPAAPAELAAKLTALAIVHQEYAPTLLEAAEQLQRQAAVCEAAREVVRLGGTAATNPNPRWALEAALAAMEATDAR